MSGLNINPDEMEEASRLFQEALKRFTEAQSNQDFSNPDPDREDKMNVLQGEVDQAREALFAKQADFRQRVQAQMQAARAGMGGGARGFAMPSRGSMPPMPGGMPSMPGGMPPMPGRGIPGMMNGHNPVVPPLAIEKVWACPECGNRNINWKNFKGKKRRKSYAKRYGLVERQIRREGGVRICMMCGQRMGRDVRLVEMTLGDVQGIKEEYEQAKVDGTLYRKKKEKKNDQ